MKVYQEITLLPSVDIELYFLWEKVFQQIHLALVEIQDENHQVSVGIAFPGYSCKPFALGTQLRLFAPEESHLQQLEASKWLNRLSDYVHITGIRSVGNVQGHVRYKRQQPKSSVERLARRKAQRENIPLEQALDALKAFQEQQVKTPYIHIKSHSSNHRFRLFINQETAQQACEGRFNTYGLSLAQATVPHF
ncbi:MAG: type I-F CRISPR-associated endoribonuclease Cas6/Csy4 [Candidatus Sericytochromatia bacterium]